MKAAFSSPLVSSRAAAAPPISCSSFSPSLLGSPRPTSRIRLLANLAGATISSRSPFFPEKLPTASARSMAPSVCLFRLAAVGVSFLPSSTPTTRAPDDGTLGAAKEMFINPLTERMRRARPCGDRPSQEYPKGDKSKVQQTVSASGQIQGPKGLRGSLFGVDKLQVFDWTEVGTARYVSG